ncbi:MAG: GDSL-type esterase/lipase family protein [Bacteroidales bacterium]|jgi:lysophospholipase L1-like esterase|nr:GDSL-type esterase/lipase family protein [Bacteroidales bacterium]
MSKGVVKRNTVDKRSSKMVIVVCVSLVVIIIVTLALVMRSTLNSFNKLSETERGSKPIGFILMNETAKKGQTVFLGDSITENYRVSEFFADYTAEKGRLVYNRGISGEVSGEMNKRFEQTVLPLAPQNIVILIGTNDLARGVEPVNIAKNIEQVLSLSRSTYHETNIILQAVYPTNPTITDSFMRMVLHGRRTAASIKTLNGLLEEKAQMYNAIWLDVSSSLVDEAGNLDKRFTFDGLHLNAAGYRVVTEKILPLLQ